MMTVDQVTQAQKKIIIAVIIFIVVFIIFLSFVYAPSKRKVSQLKSELAAIEQELKDIQMIAGQAGSLEESIALLKERFIILEGKFPAKEEEVLRKISDLAHQLKINFTSFTPGAKKIVTQSDGTSLKVDQRICRSVTVTIEMNSSYESLVKYIKALNHDLPALITVEKLELSRTGAFSSGSLSVKLKLKFYLLS